jgi:hypothetical protein
MAEKQGSAEAKLRGNTVVIVANANIMGRRDDKDVWRGERITDWDAFAKSFQIGIADEDLGSALRTCLLRSRLMSGGWADEQRGAGDYDSRLAGSFDLSSSRGLYPGMKDVSVDWSLGEVRFGPSRNRRGGVFEGFEIGTDRGHEDIKLPFDSADDQFGWALREAFRRSL